MLFPNRDVVAGCDLMEMLVEYNTRDRCGATHKTAAQQFACAAQFGIKHLGLHHLPKIEKRTIETCAHRLKDADLRPEPHTDDRKVVIRLFTCVGVNTRCNAV